MGKQYKTTYIFGAGASFHAGYAVAFGGIIVHQVGDSQNPAPGSPDELESRGRVNPLPLTQCTNDVIDLPDFVLRAFARIDIRNVDDRLFR